MTMRLLFIIIVLLGFFPGYSQEIRETSTIKKGTVLTKTDIAFMVFLLNRDTIQSRGAVNSQVTIRSHTYSEGHILTKADVRNIKKAINIFQFTNPGLKNINDDKGGASRGAGICYYWGCILDRYGYKTFYKIWYYC